jgi:hypothetical protein
MSTQKAARGSRKRVRRNATNIEAMARKFVQANNIRYCRHWNGHFCDICAEIDLVVLLNNVLVAGRNEMSREIFTSVIPERDATVELLDRKARP